MSRPPVLIGLAIALLFPAAAPAATTVESPGAAILVDGDATVNTITISSDNVEVVISDASGPVVDAAGDDECQQDGPRVRCGTLVEQEVVVRAGDGDDTLTADTNAVFVVLSGQGGNDVLNSSPAFGVDAELSGGEGNDTLNARAGTLGTNDRGDAGDDTFNGGAEGGDRFQQEPGADSYSGGTAAKPCAGGRLGRSPTPCPDIDSIVLAEGPVTVTLDGAPGDGRAGEGDNVGADVEGVYGTPADDVLSAAGVTTRRDLAGSGGDDTITGGSGNDQLDGGAGADHVSGGGGGDHLLSGFGETGAPAADRLDGGDGDDIFSTGPGPDDLVGGAGIDRVSYLVESFGPTPVGFEITLDDQPNDGVRGAGEADNVHADVDVVETGLGADRIVGSGAADQLYAGSGDDEIDGGGGVDLIDGGDGVDSIVSRDRGFDTVNCGEGVDATVQADEGDRLENCEAWALTPLAPRPDTTRPQVALGGATRISARAFRRARGVTLTARTNETSSLLARVVVRGVVARAGDLVIGERSLPLAGAGKRRFKIRFSRRDVRAIQRKLRRRAFRLTVRVTATDAAGNRTTASRRITIRKR